jgi:XTP/dITP diphosphohydrolase
MKIVIATENPGKMKEIQHFFAPFHIKLVAQSDFNTPTIAETGLSFVENAIIKARHASKYSDLPALADDSGLCVDALEGEPGIYSARYAGEQASAAQNNEKLLDRMQNYHGETRRAHFFCAIAFVRHAQDPVPIICQGIWDGIIMDKPQGDKGFGYDPIFFIPQLQCTAAQLDPLQKNSLSHRAKALQAFMQVFTQTFPLYAS